MMKNISKDVINNDEFDLICKYLKIRYESNISQRELSNKIGIAQSTIARWKRICTLCQLVIFVNYYLL